MGRNDFSPYKTKISFLGLSLGDRIHDVLTNTLVVNAIDFL